MRIGVCLPFSIDALKSRPPGPEDIQVSAKAIESAGFASAWTFDALARGVAQPDSLTVLAVAAAVTARIELCTGILQVPLRHHFELAQRVMTVQLTSNNRLLLGVGAGSSPRDFAAVDRDFSDRFRALDVSLHAMRQLWHGEVVNGVALPPWPTTAGGPPIAIGSWSGSRWIDRAAQDYDGWVTSGAHATWSELEAGIGRYRDAGGARAIVTNVLCEVADDDVPAGPDDHVRLRGTPRMIRERLARLEALGFDDVALAVPARHTRARLESIRDVCRD